MEVDFKIGLGFHFIAVVTYSIYFLNETYPD